MCQRKELSVSDWSEVMGRKILREEGVDPEDNKRLTTWVSEFLECEVEAHGFTYQGKTKARMAAQQYVTDQLFGHGGLE